MWEAMKTSMQDVRLARGGMMNKKKRAAAMKHRKAQAKGKGPTDKKVSVRWTYAVGRIPEGELDQLKRTIKASELRRSATVSQTKLDPGYVRAAIRTKQIAALLLEHSLKEGMLRKWGDRIRIQDSISI